MKRMNLQKLGRNSIISGLILLLAFGYPGAVYADSTTPTQPQTTTSVPETTPETTPTTTNTTEPQSTYTYDATTGHWNSNQWEYDKSSGTYQAVPSTPPPTSTTSPTTTTPTAPTEGSTSTTTTDSTSTSASTATNAVNSLNSLAKSGDADVLNNTTGGDATSGNASASATIINNVNSIATNKNNQEAASFVSNVMGDVNGDIMLQPMLLKAMLEAGAAKNDSNSTTNLNNTSGTTNNVNLASSSGDAKVAGNTTAGNATTGSANTVANVVNIINSMIAANQSFVGTVNIYGNLNGDILIAPDFIPQMIANNQLSQSQVKSSNKVSASDTQSIVNNVKLAAQSGAALVTGNTTAGNAKSGSANTNLVIFNLTGHQIVAHDSMLVFVNVLGKWVGAIVDAPASATAAIIGSGVTEKQSSAKPNLVVNVNNNAAITNNINLAAQSGGAVVADNTTGGDAVSGDATSSANILNASDNQITLSGWFGILFINVFGSWAGSFGIDTPAGTIHSPTNKTQKTRPVEFVPRSLFDHQDPVDTTIVSPNKSDQNVKLASASTPPSSAVMYSPANINDSRTETPSLMTKRVNLPVLIGSILLTLISAYGAWRFLA